MLQIELKRCCVDGSVVCKGAVDDFAADVYVVYKNAETKYTSFFEDSYNKGVYTMDYNRGDIIYASMGVPFYIRVETTINGQKLHGESGMLLVGDESVIVSIELYAGELRVSTRSPRMEDLSYDVAFVGGAIYELQDGQVAIGAGVICAPSSSCALLDAGNFTIENLQDVSGYRADSRAFGLEDGVEGRYCSYLPFEVKLTGLQPMTAYRVRAYAVIDSIVHYGQIVEFSTMRSGPALLTMSATEITKNSLQMNAGIVSDGGAVSDRGFIVGRSRYLDHPQIIACGSGGGSFNAVVSGLNPCTRIFYKPYAKTTYGTYYGEIFSASTYDDFVDGRDGNLYEFVVVGGCKWMTENMRYLPNVSPVDVGCEDIGRENEKHYYVYGYSGTSVEEASSSVMSQSIEEVPSGTNCYSTFGVLYDYNAAISACPEGWHLPTDGEWAQLEVYLQNNGFNSNGVLDCDINRLTNNYTAKSLSSRTLWCNSTYENTVGFETNRNNASGLSALPGGYRSSSSDGYYGLGKDTYFWTATTDGNNAYGRSIGFTNDGFNKDGYAKSDGISVRCVKNN